jgi:hypothetical protein
MHFLANAYKQLDKVGLMPTNTIHIQRVMITNNIIKLREPTLLTPFL